MKFGKFEISEYFIGAMAFILFILIMLHYTTEEERIKEETEQLRIQQNIVEMQTNKEVD